MVYKNLLLRFLISILFVSIYVFIILIDKNLIKYFVLLIYLLILIELLLYFRIKFIPFIYLLVSIYFIFYLKNIDLISFNYFIILIISFDIFSYLVGSIYGRTKFIKKLSPNKTLEGFVGGIIFSFITGFIYIFFLQLNLNFFLIIFTIIIILSAFVGDLLESYFKRINNLKNSSNLLPGHGGFFDRFDSFVFAIIPYSLLYKNLL